MTLSFDQYMSCLIQMSPVRECISASASSRLNARVVSASQGQAVTVG